MFPVRCYTCNSLLGHKFDTYCRLMPNVKLVMDECGVNRLCCRRMILSYVDFTSEQLDYPNDDITLEPGVILRKRCTTVRRVSCD